MRRSNWAYRADWRQAWRQARAFRWRQGLAAAGLVAGLLAVGVGLERASNNLPWGWHIVGAGAVVVWVLHRIWQRYWGDSSPGNEDDRHLNHKAQFRDYASAIGTKTEDDESLHGVKSRKEILGVLIVGIIIGTVLGFLLSPIWYRALWP